MFITTYRQSMLKSSVNNKISEVDRIAMKNLQYSNK